MVSPALYPDRYCPLVIIGNSHGARDKQLAYHYLFCSSSYTIVTVHDAGIQWGYSVVTTEDDA
jgi:hypothetical protein